MRKAQDLKGEIFGRLKVLEWLPSAGTKRSRWKCLCECENEHEVTTTHLLAGDVRSCGCLREELNKERKKTHGMSKHTLYNVWNRMRERCGNPKYHEYHYYGGRGIHVCSEWLIADNFLSWAKARWKPGLQIDRRNNELGYSPENCRFVTPQINVLNQRIRRTNKTGYTGVYFDKTKQRYISAVASKQIGGFITLKCAVDARNNFIRENQLPNKIQPFRESCHDS